MNEDKIIKATAYHEAGHALAAYRFNHDIGPVSIVPENDVAGICRSEGEWADGSKDIEQIIVLYAGYASESKYNENANKLRSSSDDEKAAYLLEWTNETETNLRAKAKKIIDDNWIIIEAIAERLFMDKTLEADEWSIMIDAFDEGDDPEETLRRYRNRRDWPS